MFYWNKPFKLNFKIKIYVIGELKNPLLNKNIVIPIIGPIPNTKSTNFAEFFV